VTTKLQGRTMAMITAPATASCFWADPKLIASGELPMFEPEYPDLEGEDLNIPFMNLTKEERAEKSKKFKFGLCCDCDYGLEDEVEFVRCSDAANSGAVMCNECHYYHMDMFERSNDDGEQGGCH